LILWPIFQFSLLRILHWTFDFDEDHHRNSTIVLAYNNSNSLNRTKDFDDALSNKLMTPVILVLIHYFVRPTFSIKIILTKIRPNTCL
jgi:hypothetical protein